MKQAQKIGVKMTNKFRKFETQEELIAEAEKRSAKVFSKKENYKDIYAQSNGKYFFFPGIDYFKRGTITPDMISRLQSGCNLLSVGSGDGHLERLISAGFRIPKRRIVVSDIELDQRLIECGFKRYQFDMTRPWPELDEKFDYILFPQSLGVATLPGKIRELSTSEQEAIQVRLKEEEIKRYFDEPVIEDELSKNIRKKEAVWKHLIIKEALSRLKRNGELRICYGLNDESRICAYVVHKLKEEYPEITFPAPNEGENFTIKMP